MRKIAFYLLCFSATGILLSGCANTVDSIGGVGRGISKDIQSNWKALNHWDQKFRANWW